MILFIGKIHERNRTLQPEQQSLLMMWWTAPAPGIEVP